MAGIGELSLYGSALEKGRTSMVVDVESSYPTKYRDKSYNGPYFTPDQHIVQLEAVVNTWDKEGNQKQVSFQDWLSDRGIKHEKGLISVPTGATNLPFTATQAAEKVYGDIGTFQKQAPNEQQMSALFKEFVEEYKPEILIGQNIVGHDSKVLNAWMERNNQESDTFKNAIMLDTKITTEIIGSGMGLKSSKLAQVAKAIPKLDEGYTPKDSEGVHDPRVDINRTWNLYKMQVDFINKNPMLLSQASMIASGMKDEMIEEFENANSIAQSRGGKQEDFANALWEAAREGADDERIQGWIDYARQSTAAPKEITGDKEDKTMKGKLQYALENAKQLNQVDPRALTIAAQMMISDSGFTEAITDLPENLQGAATARWYLVSSRGAQIGRFLTKLQEEQGKPLKDGWVDYKGELKPKDYNQYRDFGIWGSEEQAQLSTLFQKFTGTYSPADKTEPPSPFDFKFFSGSIRETEQAFARQAALMGISGSVARQYIRQMARPFVSNIKPRRKKSGVEQVYSLAPQSSGRNYEQPRFGGAVTVGEPSLDRRLEKLENGDVKFPPAQQQDAPGLFGRAFDKSINALQDSIRRIASAKEKVALSSEQQVINSILDLKADTPVNIIRAWIGGTGFNPQAFQKLAGLDVSPLKLARKQRNFVDVTDEQRARQKFIASKEEQIFNSPFGFTNEPTLFWRQRAKEIKSEIEEYHLSRGRGKIRRLSFDAADAYYREKELSFLARRVAPFADREKLYEALKDSTDIEGDLRKVLAVAQPASPTNARERKALEKFYIRTRSNDYEANAQQLFDLKQRDYADLSYAETVQLRALSKIVRSQAKDQLPRDFDARLQKYYDLSTKEDTTAGETYQRRMLRRLFISKVYPQTESGYAIETKDLSPEILDQREKFNAVNNKARRFRSLEKFHQKVLAQEQEFNDLLILDPQSPDLYRKQVALYKAKTRYEKRLQKLNLTSGTYKSKEALDNALNSRQISYSEYMQQLQKINNPREKVAVTKPDLISLYSLSQTELDDLVNQRKLDYSTYLEIVRNKAAGIIPQPKKETIGQKREKIIMSGGRAVDEESTNILSKMSKRDQLRYYVRNIPLDQLMESEQLASLEKRIGIIQSYIKGTAGEENKARVVQLKQPNYFKRIQSSPQFEKLVASRYDKIAAEQASFGFDPNQLAGYAAATDVLRILHPEGFSLSVHGDKIVTGKGYRTATGHPVQFISRSADERAAANLARQNQIAEQGFSGRFNDINEKNSSRSKQAAPLDPLDNYGILARSNKNITGPGGLQDSLSKLLMQKKQAMQQPEDQELSGKLIVRPAQFASFKGKTGIDTKDYIMEQIAKAGYVSETNRQMIMSGSFLMPTAPIKNSGVILPTDIVGKEETAPTYKSNTIKERILGYEPPAVGEKIVPSRNDYVPIDKPKKMQTMSELIALKQAIEAAGEYKLPPEIQARIDAHKEKMSKGSQQIGEGSQQSVARPRSRSAIWRNMEALRGKRQRLQFSKLMELKTEREKQAFAAGFEAVVKISKSAASKQRLIKELAVYFDNSDVAAPLLEKLVLNPAEGYDVDATGTVTFSQTKRQEYINEILRKAYRTDIVLQKMFNSKYLRKVDIAQAKALKRSGINIKDNVTIGDDGFRPRYQQELPFYASRELPFGTLPGLNNPLEKVVTSDRRKRATQLALEFFDYPATFVPHIQDYIDESEQIHGASDFRVKQRAVLMKVYKDPVLRSAIRPDVREKMLGLK